MQSGTQLISCKLGRERISVLCTMVGSPKVWQSLCEILCVRPGEEWLRRSARQFVKTGNRSGEPVPVDEMLYWTICGKSPRKSRSKSSGTVTTRAFGELTTVVSADDRGRRCDLKDLKDSCRTRPESSLCRLLKLKIDRRRALTDR